MTVVRNYKKALNTDGDVRIGIPTADKYDKSRYKWDKKLKKVVYTPVGKKDKIDTNAKSRSEIMRQDLSPRELKKITGYPRTYKLWNGASSRGAELPKVNKMKINQANIPDNMRPKEIYIDIENGKDIVIKTVTQEDYTQDDFNKYAEEIKRTFTERSKEFGNPKFDVTFKSFTRGEGNWNYKYDEKKITINGESTETKKSAKQKSAKSERPKNAFENAISEKINEKEYKLKNGMTSEEPKKEGKSGATMSPEESYRADYDEFIDFANGFSRSDVRSMSRSERNERYEELKDEYERLWGKHGYLNYKSEEEKLNDAWANIKYAFEK